jgi:twitching motility protein PilT
VELFQRILKTAIEGGASDVHLKIGTPVVFRINRELIAVDSPHPTAEWMGKIVEAITPVHLKKRLDEEREIDFSYFVPGIGRFPHQSVSTARPMVSGHAFCQDAGARL